MSKKQAELFGKLAEGLEGAAAAARELEAAYANADAKSGSAAVDAVAAGGAGSKGAKGPAAAAVAGKPAKGGKAKPPAITFDDVKSKLTDLMNVKGKDVVKAIMSEFGIAKLGELEEDNYADVHAKAVAALVEEEPDDPNGEDDMFGD